ncbi:TetR/AcrR family transcriptional regulator [Actinoplanes sp. G11-F43]|uniref:TetR/AcrR family transcriptional regulator n=1 Tax=Actinoplanes sp. G11-F43 TaxID=3424130 RepID=UPI003D33041B
MPRTDRRPRQRLDAETRRAEILRAAGEAFSTQPYAQVSVARVAETAGASEALVHRYFAGKGGLYTAVVEAGVRRLIDSQRAAVRADPGTARDHVAATVRIYLDLVAEWSPGWLHLLRSPGGEPVAATALRRETRDTYATLLRELLLLPDDPRLDYAIYGYLSFLDAACECWAERNHPAEDREPITEQALATLSAALTAAGHPGVLR